MLDEKGWVVTIYTGIVVLVCAVIAAVVLFIKSWSP